MGLWTLNSFLGVNVTLCDIV